MMELILNDFSMHGQFDTEETFEDYFLKELKDVLDMVADRKVLFYKRMDTFARFITKDMTYAAYLSRLFFVWEEKLMFLNGFVKKTQQTPESEKKKAREILRKME